MELSEQEYNSLGNLDFSKIEELREKIIKEKDQKAAFLYAAFSVFEQLRKNLKRIPTLEEMNIMLNLIDKVEIENA